MANESSPCTLRNDVKVMVIQDALMRNVNMANILPNIQLHGVEKKPPQSFTISDPTQVALTIYGTVRYGTVPYACYQLEELRDVGCREYEIIGKSKNW